MSHISPCAVRFSAAFWLIAGVFYCGDLHGQTPAARGSSGNQSTGTSNSGGNANAGHGSGGRIGGSSAGNTARNSTINSTGSSTGNRTGNQGLNNAGGIGYTARGRWGYGGGNAGGGYGGAGAYNSADTGTTIQDMGATYPGSVSRLPHWREFGTTPLPTTFKANVDNVGANLPAVSAPVSGPSVPIITPIALSSDSGATAGSNPNGTLTLGFEPVRTVPDQVGQAIATRLAKLPSLHFVGAVRVDIAGRTAYLRGRVASEHERELAERVVLLEAGIDDVVNLIEVGSGSIPAHPLPPAPAPAVPPPPAPGIPAANG